MRTLNRIAVLTVLLGLIVSGSLGAALLGSVLSRDDMQLRVVDAVDQAKDANRMSATMTTDADQAQQAADDTGKQLMILDRQKRAQRLAMAALKKRIGSLSAEAASLLNTEVRSVTSMVGQRERVASFAHDGYLGFFVAEGQTAAGMLTERLTGESLGQSVDDQLRSEALARAQAQILLALQQTRETSVLSEAKLQQSAGDLAAEFAADAAAHDQVLAQYRALDKQHDAAEKTLQLSQDDMAEIQRETAAVQQDILQMQGEMAQIDGILRARAERALIQKGLRAPQPGMYSDQPANGTAEFLWPVDGTLSAGFHDAPYQAHFGVPHEGQDIAVPQGTEVHAIADGIVFLARDGGARGFSYILIGHRGGYASLYGHLSQFSVSAGQEVKQGQVIGLSGGTPGTHGAGPMTTGPHVHLEVIKNGVHVDPKTVLPTVAGSRT